MTPFVALAHFFGLQNNTNNTIARWIKNALSKTYHTQQLSPPNRLFHFLQGLWLTGIKGGIIWCLDGRKTLPSPWLDCHKRKVAPLRTYKLYQASRRFYLKEWDNMALTWKVHVFQLFCEQKIRILGELLCE